MLRKYVKTLPYLFLAIIVAAISSGFFGYVTIRMMKLLDFALDGDLELLKQSAPGVILMAVLLVPLSILASITGNYYKKAANSTLKKYYVTKVFGKNIAEFQKENNAKYLSALTNDFNTLETNLVTGIYLVCRGVVDFLVGIWLLTVVDARMILLAFVIIAVNLVISVLTTKPSKKAYKERSDMFDGYTSYIKEVLSAFHIIKNYNLQEKVTKDYYEKSEEIQQKGYLIERMLSFIFSTQTGLINGSLFAVICGVGYFAVMKKITPGGLLLVIEGIQRMMFPLFEIGENLPKLFTTSDLIKKIEKTLENTYTYEETIDFPEFQHEIEFQNVDFHYEDDEQLVLSDINLSIRKNGKYLVVGPSGGGKSTLLKLFRKYFNPTAGRIVIDGYDLRDIKREQFYKLIGNIEQQVFIFEDTIRNNITLYKDYSDEEISKAIEAAGLTGFVKAQPEGLDSIIYDNGKNISGGERSRIVIARALLNKASILLMDEAFASLDMERAREIEKTILGLKDMTVVNVSHVIFKDTKELYDRVITVKKSISA
ncbi:MAG: ABC transporter ATP-binding protein [Caldicoprobacterales bacterium]|jgi:ATP-binding cassette subfamily B protein|nr:ABC transporter ATP-binding protein [Clostridiales bacterium]